MLVFLVFLILELLKLFLFVFLDLVLIVAAYLWGDVLDARGED